MQIELANLGSSLVNNIPAYIVWPFGIVMAVIMLRRGGSGTVKLLLAGFILLLVSALAAPFLRAAIHGWLAADKGITEIARTLSWVTGVLAVVSLSGIVCLVTSFWKQFWKKGVEG